MKGKRRMCREEAYVSYRGIILSTDIKSSAPRLHRYFCVSLRGTVSHPRLVEESYEEEEGGGGGRRRGLQEENELVTKSIAIF